MAAEIAKRLKVGVLISGRGSNLQALIDACAQPDFPAEIALVVSNKADAYGLERARRGGIATNVVNHKDFAGREDFDSEIDRSLRDAGIELVCLAGFMRLLSPGFVTAWTHRMVNIHPSLLPAFKGLHTHQRALDAGVKIAGCSVHFVTPELDDGPIIAQAAVPVLPQDDAATLAGRILEQEHILYPLALRLIGEGRVAVVDGRVKISGDPQDALAALVNPSP